MKNTQKITIILIFFVAIYSCSTKKDTIISRNYHALTTKYNVLFNGKEAFKKGIEDINKDYKDDWFQQLPIEPIVFEEDKIVLPKFSQGPGAGFGGVKKDNEKKQLTTFEKAEDKAIKAIQKHGMNINGTEHNRQIDDAYLLLGKSRYYSQRFVPAVEAFNYVIAKYPNANLIAETKIWRAKANIRMDFEDRAIETLKLLLVVRDTLEANLPDEIKEQGHTALAMAYVKSDSLQKVKKHLHLATRTLENKDQAARNLFILGQLYSQEQKKDSASMVFQKLANFKKAPYKYKIRANIELAKNAPNDSTANIVLEKLNKLIKIRENRPYLDALYYQKGVLLQNNDSIQLAIDSYNKSLRSNGENKQKTFTYEKLGNLSFKADAYQQASKYYDSVLQISKDTLNLRIRRIKRKHKNLASLIKFEETVVNNDSIIKIASLSEEDQKVFFEKYIEKIKKADEAAAQLRLNQLAFGNTGGGLQSTGKGNWYFYNNQSLSFGKSEFQKTWGTRKLEDNWRWAEKGTTGGENKDTEKTTKVNKKYDVATYLNAIPQDKKVIDSLKTQRNQALYELGLIYKEQFKNQEIAKDRLVRVANLQPAKALILPINWHLYQIYTNLKDTNKAEKHKNLILNQYPETKFAKLILNPNSKFEEDEVALSEVENTYKEIYYLYKDNKFEEVITKVDEILPTISNSDLLSKFELLKAYAIGKFKDKEAYKTALEFVAVSYGNTEEGKKAKEIVVQLKK